MANNDYLIEEFEKEVYLFIDGSLPFEKMAFWEKKIEEVTEIRRLYNENLYILGTLEDLDTADIPVEKFDSMLRKAVSKKGLLHRVRAIIYNFGDSDSKGGLNISRIALGSALIIAAFSIWIISNKPLPVEEIDSEILEWSGSQINDKISELEGMIYAIQKEEAVNQELSKKSLDKWDANYHNIERSLKEMKKDVKSESL